MTLVGAELPPLVLESTHGPLELAELARELLVLFVYPHATGLPEPPVPGWDAIPGARGCTAQSCAFRDHRDRLAELGAALAGLSVQTVDEHAAALGLPTFAAGGRTFYERLTLVAAAERVVDVFHPVDEPEQNASDIVRLLATRRYDGLIVDLDGVVWLGGELIEGAAHAIATLRGRGTRVLFLTNDPQSSRDDYAARLSAIGVPARAADVVTSAAATATYLAAQDHLRGRSALVVGSPALRREIEAAGFELVPPSEPRRAELVVVGGHDGFDYGELRAATAAILSGAQLFATGRDPVVPTRSGPEPATGAVLAAVETATGVTATVVGKPEPCVFEVAREALAGCERVAVVGDNLAADVAGAKRAGLDAILVLTGVTGEDELAEASIQPDVVLASLAELR